MSVAIYCCTSSFPHLPHLLGLECSEGCLSQTQCTQPLPVKGRLATFSIPVCGYRESLCLGTPCSFSFSSPAHHLAFPLALPHFSSQWPLPSPQENPSFGFLPPPLDFLSHFAYISLILSWPTNWGQYTNSLAYDNIRTVLRVRERNFSAVKD